MNSCKPITPAPENGAPIGLPVIRPSNLLELHQIKAATNSRELNIAIENLAAANLRIAGDCFVRLLNHELLRPNVL